MGKRVAGICYIKVDGTQLEVKGGVECPLTSTAKEAVMGLNGVAGYKETAKRPFVKVSAIFTADFPISTLANGSNMTVTVEMANGKVFTLAGAWLEGDGNDANAEEGTIELEFSGLTGIWQ